MGIIDIFTKNKEKKRLEANSVNKKQIITIIQNVLMSCRNSEAISVLRNIQSLLQSQSETSAEEVISIDMQVIKLLNEASSFILKQQYPTALMKLNKANSLVAERQQYCFLGGQMTKKDKAAADRAASFIQHATTEVKKTRAEELQQQIDEKYSELEAQKQEYENLKKLHEQNTANAAVNAQATTVITKIKLLNSIINNLSIELSKESVDTSISVIASETEKMVKNRTHSDAEMEINRAKVASSTEQMKETQSQVQQDMSILGMSGGAFDPFADDSSLSTFDPFGVSSETTTKNTTQNGAFSASTIGTTEMANDIKKTANAIKSSIEVYTDKIEDANEELEDFNSQLRPLLQRRETSSPSDCLVLDGKIDQLNSNRSGVVYKIKRYRQAVAQLNDKLSLIDKLSTQQDISATDKKIEQLTGGKFKDFAGLSMYLNDSVKESNEMLEEINMAANVAESEEIMMNSATGASAALTDATSVKDEHKYDALKEELTATARPLR